MRRRRKFFKFQGQIPLSSFLEMKNKNHLCVYKGAEKPNKNLCHCVADKM